MDEAVTPCMSPETRRALAFIVRNEYPARCRRGSHIVLCTYSSPTCHLRVTYTFVVRTKYDPERCRVEPI